MKARIDVTRVSPKALNAMYGLESHVRSSGLDPRLLNLVKMRAAREQFSEEELVNLALAVVAINGWNRLSIAFRAEAGNYRPGMHDLRKSA